MADQAVPDGHPVIPPTSSSPLTASRFNHPALPQAAVQQVLQALPPGTRILNLAPHGSANWATGHKLTTASADGTESCYFLKLTTNHHQAELMGRGEFESQKALRKYIPDNVCVPLASGSYTDFHGHLASFFLTPFRNLGATVPRPDELAPVLAQLHTSSLSPNGKFGFGVDTFQGHMPVVNDWCDTWEGWFTRQLKADFAWEQGINGPDPEIDEMRDELFEVVVPRLLRPLESEGRKVTPVLLHGDLWEDNARVDEDDGKVVLFDAVALYAHNEFELSMIGRDEGRLLTREHLEAYMRLVPPDEPVDEFDDRQALYHMHGYTVASGLRKDRDTFHAPVVRDMKMLVAKYSTHRDK